MISLSKTDNIAPATLSEDSTASGASPSLLLEDTTASAKDCLLRVDANLLQIKDNALADGTGLVFDLANTRLGFNIAAPLKPLHIAGPSGGTGYTNNVQPQDALVVDNANNCSVNITSAATSAATLFFSTNGKSGRGSLSFDFFTDKFALTSGSQMLTLPVTGNLLSSANFEVSNTAPAIVLTDSTASAKDLTIEVDANFARLRESAGAAGSLLTLDLTNNRVGIATASPGVALDVTGAVTASGAGTFGSLSTAGATSTGTLTVGGGTSVSTIAYGSYAPTLTNTANIDTSSAATVYYIRLGAVVHVYGYMEVDATTTLTNTSMGMSLPVASDFTSGLELGGVACGSTGGGEGIRISADTTDNRARFEWVPVSVANAGYTFNFTYTIV